MKFTFVLPFLVCAVSAVKAMPLNPVELFDQSSDTREDIVNSTECKPYTIVFARGLDEPGNVGERVGPPFFAELANLVGSENLKVQGRSVRLSYRTVFTAPTTDF